MKIVTFQKANQQLTFPPEAGGQTVPCYHDGKNTIIAFQLEPADIENLKRHGNIVFVSMLTGPQIPPVTILTEPPFFNNPDAYHEIFYFDSSDATKGKWIWNARDGKAPSQMKVENTTYLRDPNVRPKFNRNKQPKIKELYLRAPTAEDAGKHTVMIGHEILCILCQVTGEGLAREMPLFVPKQSAPGKTIDLKPQPAGGAEPQ